VNESETIAGSSTISFVEKGEIRYCGILLDELLEHSTYEEVIFLLWNRRLPKQNELEQLISEIQAHQALPSELFEILAHLPKSSSILELLRTSISALGSFDPFSSDDSAIGNHRKATRMMGQVPFLVAALWKLHEHNEMNLEGSEPSIAARFLHALHGKKPSAADVRALDQAMMVYADNEFNISTFCARMAASTHADLYACIVSAVGAFQGPLHGGANEHVMEMLLRVNEPNHVGAFLDEALTKKEKIWGMGHLIYKEGDPRSPLMKKICEKLSHAKKEMKWFEISDEIERRLKNKKGLLPNVDFYAASVFHLLKIPKELFPAIFAMSRLAGWIAHSLEQMGNWKILMPRADYTGTRLAPFVPMTSRR
jgi:citrate synthase